MVPVIRSQRPPMRIRKAVIMGLTNRSSRSSQVSEMTEFEAKILPSTVSLKEGRALNVYSSPSS
jgi:hypothetical protein